MFKNVSIANNYPHYIGMNDTKQRVRFKHCKREDFYKYVEKMLDKISDDDASEKIREKKEKISNTS